jgi:steroid delta-isomerase-like uncharacterized protein
MTSEDIRTFIERYVELWEKEDVPGLVDCYAEDARIESPIFHAVEGRADIEKSFKNLFGAFGDLEIHVDDVIIDHESGDRAAFAFTTQQTHRGMLFGMRGTGRRVEISGAFILRFEHGRIAADRRIYDFTGLLVQLGVLKARAV